MKYFVTGGTGFIGGEVVRQLRAAGHEVVALVRNPARAGALADLGADLARGDILDKGSLRAPMTGVDGVFHLAGWYKIGVRDRAAGSAINVDGTRNVCEAMAAAGVPRGVYTSTILVYGDTHGALVDESYRRDGPWIAEYNRTKWQAHYEVALPAIERGLPLVIVLPGLTYGPGDTSGIATMFRDYLRGKLPAIPTRTTFCWAHVEDVARAHVAAMDRGRVGESYNLAGPPHTLVEAFVVAEKVTGVPAPKLRLSPWMLKLAAPFAGLVERVLPVPSGYAAESLRSVAGVTYIASSEKAKRELDFVPRGLEEGLRETLPILMTVNR